MKQFFKTLVAGSLLLASVAASAAVTVTFVKPDDYPDMPFSPVDRERVLKDIGDYITSLGKNLPEGTDVRIDVLDLDLAGRIEPSASATTISPAPAVSTRSTATRYMMPANSWL